MQKCDALQGTGLSPASFKVPKFLNDPVEKGVSKKVSASLHMVYSKELNVSECKMYVTSTIQKKNSYLKFKIRIGIFT